MRRQLIACAHWRMFIAAAAAACICVPVMSDAQSAVRATAAVSGTSVNATSVLANGTADMTGTLYGGEGMVAWRRFSLRLGYAQGTIGIGLGASHLSDPPGDPNSGGVVGNLLDGLLGPGGSASAPGDLDMVEGHGLLGLNVLDGLEIAAGVRGRARYTDAESERLLLYVGQVRYEAPIISQRVRAFIEGWHSVASSASESQPSGSGRGGIVGALAELGSVRTKLSYGMDQARYGSSVRRETVEGFTVSIGYVLR